MATDYKKRNSQSYTTTFSGEGSSYSHKRKHELDEGESKKPKLEKGDILRGIVKKVSRHFANKMIWKKKT